MATRRSATTQSAMLQIAYKLTPFGVVEALGQYDQQQGDRTGDDLHKQDPARGRDGAVDAGDDDAAQEENLERLAVGDETIGETGRQESVVETLVRGHRRAGLRELACGPEGCSRAVGLPQKHLEDEDVDVDGRDDAHGEMRSDLHGRKT